MNDILTNNITLTAVTNVIQDDLITAFGPQGAQHRLNVPQGWAARLWDWSVFCDWGTDDRWGVSLQRQPLPRDGQEDWDADIDVLNDGGQLASFMFHCDFTTTGETSFAFPLTEPLWEMDYRLVINPRIVGFATGQVNLGFRLRYKLVRASREQVAAILFWQNAGMKVA